MRCWRGLRTTHYIVPPRLTISGLVTDTVAGANAEETDTVAGANAEETDTVAGASAKETA